MTTKYQVRLGATLTTDPTQGHQTTVRCTCGWHVTVSGTTQAMAVQVGGKARANHLEDAHPDQPVLVSTSQAHQLLIGGSTKVGNLWTRTAVCACGWGERVTERSPDRVATVVRARHRDHLVHETGQTPLRDYLVLAGLVAVVAVLMLMVASAAIGAGS